MILGLEGYLEIGMFDLSWRDVTLAFHSVSLRKANQAILLTLPSTYPLIQSRRASLPGVLRYRNLWTDNLVRDCGHH